MRVILIVGLLFGQSVFAKLNFNQANCNQEASDELKIKMNDLGWHQPLKEMEKKYEFIYNSGKRLEWRAYKDGTEFVLPLKNGQKISIGENFIKSVTTHIETALSRQYADFIFFSDMGHTHLFVDKKVYEEKVKDVDNFDLKTKYDIMLNHKKTKFLYHTAEQLHMIGEDKLPIKDKKTQWRFFTRNIVGDNLQSKKLEIVYNATSSHNTARKLSYDVNDNYKYWGAGFSISGSKDGCFEFTHKGKKYYYDISLYDVAYDSSGDDGGGL